MNYIFLGLTFCFCMGFTLWKNNSLDKKYQQEQTTDRMTISYLREQLAQERESYNQGLAQIRRDIMNQEVIVTDRSVVLAEEPQIEDSRYVQPQNLQGPRARLVNGQWVLDKEPEGIPQHMVDSWKKPRNVVLPDNWEPGYRPGVTFQKSSYPSWHQDDTGESSWITGPTVTHLGLWTKDKGGELLGTVKLEDTILDKARAEAHDMIVGAYKRD